MAAAAEPRRLLIALVAAFEAHLDACEVRTGEADPVVFAAYNRLADAFAEYEESVYEAHDEVVPMSLLDEDDEDDDEDEDDELEDDDLEELEDLAEIDDIDEIEDLEVLELHPTDAPSSP